MRNMLLGLNPVIGLHTATIAVENNLAPTLLQELQKEEQEETTSDDSLTLISIQDFTTTPDYTGINLGELPPVYLTQGGVTRRGRISNSSARSSRVPSDAELLRSFTADMPASTRDKVLANERTREILLRQAKGVYILTHGTERQRQQLIASMNKSSSGHEITTWKGAITNAASSFDGMGAITLETAGIVGLVTAPEMMWGLGKVCTWGYRAYRSGELAVAVSGVMPRLRVAHTSSSITPSSANPTIIFYKKVLTSKSLNELAHPVDHALIQRMEKKGWTIVVAKEGSDDFRYLNSIGAEASFSTGHPKHILIKDGGTKAGLLEEYLHGTQIQLGLLKKYGTHQELEVHVKDFMLRHAQMLGLDNPHDIQLLQQLKLEELERLSRLTGK